MRLLNSLTRAASFRRLISPRKNNRRPDDHASLKPVEETNAAHFDPSEETFLPPNRTTSETCSEDTCSIASNGKEQQLIAEPLREAARPESGHETTMAKKACPSPNKSISMTSSSNCFKVEKLDVSVDPSNESEIRTPRRKSSHLSPRKTASLSRSLSTADATERCNASQTTGQNPTNASYQEDSVVAVKAFPKPKTRSLRRQPSRRGLTYKATARPKASSGNNATGKKSILTSTCDEDLTTGKQSSSIDLSIEACANSKAGPHDKDTGNCSSLSEVMSGPTTSPVTDSLASKKDSTGEECSSAQSCGFKQSADACTRQKDHSCLSDSAARSILSKTDVEKGPGAPILENALPKDKESSTADQEGSSLHTPRKLATRRVISTFEESKTSHTTSSPTRTPPVRCLQRWNSATSFLQSPSETADVLSSRQPTPFHTPATAKYSSKHKNGISLGDMLSNYDRITSSVHSQSSTTVPEGDDDSCNEGSTVASFAHDEVKSARNHEQVRLQKHPSETESTIETPEKQETPQPPMTLQTETTPITANKEEQGSAAPTTLTKLMESAKVDPYVESPQKSVQTLPPKLPFHSPPKKQQKPRGAPPAAIGRPQLHRHMSTTALLKGTRSKPSTKKPAKARRPGLHRQGSLMADNLQDFFSQYDNIYEKIVEDDSLAGW